MEYLGEFKKVSLEREPFGSSIKRIHLVDNTSTFGVVKGI